MVFDNFFSKRPVKSHIAVIHPSSRKLHLMFPSIFLWLAFLMFFTTEAAPISNSNCANAKDRSREELHAQWSKLQSDSMHESYFMTPSMAVNKGLLTKAGTETFYSGNRECVLDPKTSLEGRSLCPWYWNFTYDADRYPDILAEARCACTRCGNSTFYKCYRITYTFIVLRKDPTSCDNGYFKYEPAFQPVATGCACSLPEVD